MAAWGKKSRRNEFIRNLQKDYVDELGFAGKMKQVASHARYQQHKEKLLSIAEGEEKHAEIIKQILQRLGAEVPEEIPSPKVDNRTFFEVLNEALQLDHDDYYDSYRLLFEAEDEGLTELIPLLDEMRDEKAEHRQILLSILQTLNSYQI